jgi:LAO/AO transport system kinase
VLAIDPSSVISGGSILGDKTRMNELSRNSNVFIRATPSRGILGGVAQHTNEAILMCEAAGYDISIIETVGVGQSEIAVAEICDLVLLLVPPAGGDELQGIKKGIIEIADMVIINKADGDLVEVAKRAKAEYLRGLQLVRPRMPEVWKPKVLTCSSANLNGIDHVWEQIQLFEKNTGNFGILDDRRRKQRKKWLWREVREQLVQILNEDKENNASLQDQILKSEEAVDLDTSTPRSAASKIIHAFLKVDFEKRLPNSN